MGGEILYRFIHFILLFMLLNFSLSASETKVTLELKWLHQFQFAGFYMAKEKGFYRDAGLDVEFIEGLGQDSFKSVKSGKADFAVGTSALAIERSHGFPLVALGIIFQDSPVVWLTSTDLNISKPADFIGKTVMCTPCITEGYELKALFKKAGIDPTRMKYVPTTSNIDDFITKKVDIYPAYKSNEPFLLKDKGIDYQIIDPDDYDIHFFGDVLFTSEAMLHTHPEAVKAFRDASFKGWKYAFDHLEESVDLVMKKYNPQNKTREHILFEAHELQKFALYPFMEPGHMHRRQWEQIIQQYNELGMMHGSINLDTFLYDMKSSQHNVWLLRAIYILIAFLLLLSILFFSAKKYNKILHKKVSFRTKELNKLNEDLESIVAQKTWEVEREKDNLLKAESIAHFGSYLWHIQTNEITWSDEHYRIFGVNKETFNPTLSGFMNFVHPDDKQHVIDKLQEIINTKSSQLETFVFRFIREDGEERYIQSTSSITKHDNEGKALQVVGTALDITLQKKSENKLLKINKKIYQSEQRLNKAQAIAHLGNWDWDILSGEIYWSDELFRILGEETQSFKPTLRHFIHYIPKKEKKRINQYIKESLKGEYQNLDLIYSIKRKNGALGYVHAFIEITRNDLGEPIYASGILLDITKANKKTEALIQMKKELERSNASLVKAKNITDNAIRAKSSFLANMSHEIRTPLNAITGFIALLKEDETDTEKLKYLRTIDSASHTLLHTINDILDFSKLESGKFEIVKSDFKPFKEIMATAELFQAKAAEKNIVFSIIYDKKVPKVLFSDILRIKQIITNLLSNAIKFTPQNGAIDLSIAYTDNRLSVSIRDNGIGIPKDKQEYIFDSFAQADNTTTKKYGGTGLGLSISAQLIRMLNGEFNLKSTEKIGSTFSFSIPMREGHLTTEKKLDHNLNKPFKGKILLVEDIVTNQMFIGLVLERAGLKYEVANDGIEAVEKFQTETYDLILMDENMPRLNGRGAVELIRNIEKKKLLQPTPIIALTANALSGDKELFLNAGMDGYLSKPVEPTTLIAILHEFLDSHT